MERAHHWARTKVVPKTGGRPVVLGALIDLSNCLDFTTMNHRQLYSDVAEAVYENMPTQQKEELKQSYYVRQFDCLVIESILAHPRYWINGEKYTTVRGAFAEGESIFRSPDGRIASQIRSLDHIQINVVERSAIKYMAAVPKYRTFYRHP